MNENQPVTGTSPNKSQAASPQAQFQQSQATQGSSGFYFHPDNVATGSSYTPGAVYSSSANPVVTPVTAEESLAAQETNEPVQDYGSSYGTTPYSNASGFLSRFQPMLIARVFAILVLVVGGAAFGISKLSNQSEQPSSPVSSQTSQTSSGILPDTSGTLNLNYDTVVGAGKSLTASQLVAGSEDKKLAVIGDLQASGTIYTSDGATSLSNTGLVINKVTVCTTSGCIPNSNPTATVTTTGGTGTAGAAGTAGTAGAKGDKGDTGATGATGPAGPATQATCPLGNCVSLQATAGSAETGNLNVSGAVTASSFSGSGASLANVNAATLQGNAASFFTNATNLSSGTLADARLSSNVSLLGSAIDSSEITDGSIANADISATAAIAYSKLNLAGTIANSDIAAAAAIAYSKLNLTGTLANSDIAAAAAIAYSKLNLAGTIVNADISNTAAIDYAKLNLAGNITNSDVSNTAAIAYSKLNLAGSVTNADLAGSIADTKLNTISTAGKVADSALSNNVALVNGSQTFTGSPLFKNTADSATALRIQNSLGTNLVLVDTTAGTVTISGLQGSGASLTSINASNVSSGTLADARLSANVSLLGSTIDSAEITDGTITNSDVNAAAAIDWTKLSKTGSSLADLTARSAADLSSGTLADARLSANVALLNGSGPQTFTGNNKFSGTALFQNAADSTTAFRIQNSLGTNLVLVDTTAGTVTIAGLQGSGANLTSLNADNISSGTLADARLSANVSLLGSSIDSTEITNDSIVNADINSAAAIAYSKLNLGTSIVNADINAAAAIDWSKISKTGSSLADLTTRSAADLSSGTLSDARLSSNVVLTTGANTFTADQTVRLDSATAFKVQNSASKSVLSADTTNGKVILGNSGASGVTGAAQFNYSGQTGSVALTPANPGATAYTVTIPAENGTVCTTGSVCSGYAPATGGNYLGRNVQESSSAAITAGNYLYTFTNTSSGVASGVMKLDNGSNTSSILFLKGGSTTALQLQNASSFNVMVLDSTNAHLKIYDGAATQAYVDIYYDSANSQAVLTASNGATRIGSAGPIKFLTSTATNLVSFQHSGTPSGSYSLNDITMTRQLSGGANPLTGALLRIEDLSNFTSGSVAPDLLSINQNNTSATGNLILAQTGGSGSKFKVDTTGTVTLASGASYTGAGALTLQSGGSGQLTISGNGNGVSVADNVTYSNGKSLTVNGTGNFRTWTDSTTAFRVQNAVGDAVVTVDTTNTQFKLKTASSTPALLVLSDKNTVGDPTCVNGAIYYNSAISAFRGCQGGSWHNMIAGYDIQAFNGNGTWTKPAYATFVRVIAIGGGGGGGQGYTGGLTWSGGGGGGGAYNERIYTASELGAAESIVVGAGGTGGIGSGNHGTAGGRSGFGNWLSAFGGGGGYYGNDSGYAAGGGGANEAGITGGRGGSNAWSSAYYGTGSGGGGQGYCAEDGGGGGNYAAAGGGASIRGGGGGGGGTVGGNNYTGSAGGGRAGGGICTGGGGSGGSYDTSSGLGQPCSIGASRLYMGGDGGGGGGYGQQGCNGGFPGGGGGGGGYNANGGSGAPGRVVVISW